MHFLVSTFISLGNWKLIVNTILPCFIILVYKDSRHDRDIMATATRKILHCAFDVFLEISNTVHMCARAARRAWCGAANFSYRVTRLILIHWEQAHIEYLKLNLYFQHFKAKIHFPILEMVKLWYFEIFNEFGIFLDNVTEFIREQMYMTWFLRVRSPFSPQFYRSSF